MSFRQFGGLNYAARHNIVSSNYNTSNNLLVTQNVGQPNSFINFQSDISGNVSVYGGNLYVGGDIDISGNLTAKEIFLTGNLNVSLSSYSPSYPGAYLFAYFTSGSTQYSVQLPIFASIPAYSGFYNTYYPPGSTSEDTFYVSNSNYNGVKTSVTSGGTIAFFNQSLTINEQNGYYILNPGYKIIFYQTFNFNYGFT